AGRSALDAEATGGVPRYDYQADPETGVITKHARTLSMKEVLPLSLLAFTAQALSGAGQHGPGSLGRSVAAGADFEKSTYQDPRNQANEHDKNEVVAAQN